MPVKHRSALTVLFAMLALNGCDSVSGVSSGSNNSSTAHSVIEFSRSRGAILTQIHGRPFGLKPAIVKGKVMPLIQGSLDEKLFKFTAEAKNASVANISFRIAFGYPKSEQNDRLCGDHIPQLIQEKKNITAVAALCDDGEVVFEASGWAKGVNTPDDYFFRSLVTDLTRAVLDLTEAELYDDNGDDVP